MQFLGNAIIWKNYLGIYYGYFLDMPFITAEGYSIEEVSRQLIEARLDHDEHLFDMELIEMLWDNKIILQDDDFDC